MFELYSEIHEIQLKLNCACHFYSWLSSKFVWVLFFTIEKEWQPLPARGNYSNSFKFVVFCHLEAAIGSVPLCCEGGCLGGLVEGFLSGCFYLIWLGFCLVYF